MCFEFSDQSELFALDPSGDGNVRGHLFIAFVQRETIYIYTNIYTWREREGRKRGREEEGEISDK